MIEIRDDDHNSNFQSEVMKAGDSKVVLVDFWANWCSPCKAMNPILEEVQNEFGGKLKIAKVNIEDNQAIANRFSVRSIPNFLLVVNGKVVSQFVGAVSKAKLVQEITDALLFTVHH